jgi:hypothetical protein
VTAVRFAGARLAVTPFVGFGSARGTLASAQLAGPPATASDTGSVIQNDEIPIGAAVGWRARLGEARALALSLSPAYVLYRRSGGTIGANRQAFRVATVAELALAPRIGVTVSGEFGQSAASGEPGPTGSRVGIGLSFAIARH